MARFNRDAVQGIIRSTALVVLLVLMGSLLFSTGFDSLLPRTADNPINSLIFNNMIFHIPTKEHTGIAGYPPLEMLSNDKRYLEVSQSKSNSFQTINSALDYISLLADTTGNYNTSFCLNVSPGTYPESIVIGAPGITIPSLEIKGDGGQPTITGGYGSLNRTISVHPQASIGQLILRDLDFAGGRQSGQVFVPNNVGDLQIINCSFHDLIINHGLPLSISDPLYYYGTAIQSYSPTLVSGCDFYHNQGVWTQDPDLWDVDGNYYSSLGILYLTGNSIVENCQIYDNSAAIAGAIHLSGANNIIQNNTISSNITLDPSSEAVAIRAYNAPGTIIRDNIFLDNGINDGQLCNGAVIWMGGTTNQSTPSSIVNNTFSNGSELVPTDLRAIRLEGTANVLIQNNVLSNFPKAITNNSQFASDQILKNNLFWDNPVNFTGSIYNASLNPGNCIFDEDPELDANYFPIWNSSTISPCIDSGLGVDAGDGTPADIGAKRAVHHQYWEYTFLNQADQEKWYWVSYPVLNTRTNDVLVASEFFNELLPVHENLYGDDEPTYLQQIDWREGNNTEETHLLWDENDWTATQTSHYVSSPQGYKIKLLPRSASPMQITLRESGFRTHSNTEFPLYGMNDNAHAENWLGYFIEGSAWPHDVFADIWDDVNMIKTKNWCLVRSEYQGDYWGLHGKIGKLNYGDMVIVTTNNDHSFQWNDGDDDTPPYYSGTPEHFVYDEKPDYVPLFITIPDEAMANLKEIGLYLDGVCKGAVVVENNIEQISAYLGIDEKLTDGVVDFVFYYHDSKAQHQERKMIRMDAERFSANYVSGNRRYLYYDLAFTPEDMENAVTPEVHLNQNYPNPFNPSTTISYSLPEAGQVRLEIYNLRGQLVKVLANGEEAAGDHRKVWNGTDANGNAVSSGVYFYRLTSPGRTISKRMLLMK